LFTLADTIGGAAAASRGNRMTTISGDVFNEKEELLAQGTFSFYNFDTPLLKQ